MYVISENCPKFMGIQSLPLSGPINGPCLVVIKTVRGEAAVQWMPCKSRVSSLGASDPVISSQLFQPSRLLITPATSNAAYISSGAFGSAVIAITRVGNDMSHSLDPITAGVLCQESPLSVLLCTCPGAVPRYMVVGSPGLNRKDHTPGPSSG